MHGFTGAALADNMGCVGGSVAFLGGIIQEIMKAQRLAVGQLGSGIFLAPKPYSPPEVERIWGMWGSYYNIPKPIFYLLKGDHKS